MYAVPTSIFANLPTWAIRAHLSSISANTEMAGPGAEIPEALVLELFAALEAKLPEVSLAIEEIPECLTPDGIEYVLMAAESAIAAREENLRAA